MEQFQTKLIFQSAAEEHTQLWSVVSETFYSGSWIIFSLMWSTWWPQPLLPISSYITLPHSPFLYFFLQRSLCFLFLKSTVIFCSWRRVGDGNFWPLWSGLLFKHLKITRPFILGQFTSCWYFCCVLTVLKEYLFLLSSIRESAFLSPSPWQVSIPLLLGALLYDG